MAPIMLSKQFMKYLIIITMTFSIAAFADQPQDNLASIKARPKVFAFFDSYFAQVQSLADSATNAESKSYLQDLVNDYQTFRTTGDDRSFKYLQIDNYSQLDGVDADGKVRDVVNDPASNYTYFFSYNLPKEGPCNFEQRVELLNKPEKDLKRLQLLTSGLKGNRSPIHVKCVDGGNRLVFESDYSLSSDGNTFTSYLGTHCSQISILGEQGCGINGGNVQSLVSGLHGLYFSR